MVERDVLVTTLPLAYVSYCMPNFFGSRGLFHLANEHAFINEEP
jgi:hypothetical protein